MSSKKAKCYKQEQRIKQLENEVEDLKRALEQQTKTVQFDEQQIEKILAKITNEIDISTNKICDEVNQAVKSIKEPKTDEISEFIKMLLGTLLIAVAISIVIFIFIDWARFLNNGLVGIIYLVVHVIYSCIFITMGRILFKEKDRNYIVSLFSAVVALTALFVTLVK